MKTIFFSSEELKSLIKESIQEVAVLNSKNQTNFNQEILTIEEAAQFLRISKHTIRKYVKLGLLKRTLTEIKGYRFHRSELSRFSNWYR